MNQGQGHRPEGRIVARNQGDRPGARVKPGGTPAGEAQPGETPGLQLFDPDAELEVRTRKLPHWRQKGTTAFVTFRLGDSLPQQKLRSLRAERLRWLREHPAPLSRVQRRHFAALLSAKIEAYLAAGYGACWLSRAEVAEIVERSLRHFDGQRYFLAPYVIMPNHVHLLVTPAPAVDPSEILHTWKSFTSHEINRLVRRRGRLWQEESYDHLIRSEEELRSYVAYIEANPKTAGLDRTEYRLGRGSAAL